MRRSGHLSLWLWSCKPSGSELRFSLFFFGGGGVGLPSRCSCISTVTLVRQQGLSLIVEPRQPRLRQQPQHRAQKQTHRHRNTLARTHARRNPFTLFLPGPPWFGSEHWCVVSTSSHTPVGRTGVALCAKGGGGARVRPLSLNSRIGCPAVANGGGQGKGSLCSRPCRARAGHRHCLWPTPSQRGLKHLDAHGSSTG